MKLEPIDWITLQKQVADLAEQQRRESMKCEKLAHSDDSQVATHKDYWLRLAERHAGMARVLDAIWRAHLTGKD